MFGAGQFPPNQKLTQHFFPLLTKLSPPYFPHFTNTHSSIQIPNFPITNPHPHPSSQKSLFTTHRISVSAHPNSLSITCCSNPDHIFNFAAGPATLPEIVLKKAQPDLFIYKYSGFGF